MSKSKEDITYGTAQARLSEDEALRIRYKAGTPLEGGKIADSQPADLFSAARNIDQTQHHQIAESKPVDVFSSAHNIPNPQEHEETRSHRQQGSAQ